MPTIHSGTLIKFEDSDSRGGCLHWGHWSCWGHLALVWSYYRNLNLLMNL
jgi:hypothetical protein